MSRYSAVSIEKKGNSYFNGQVTSRTLHFADGQKKTLGFMLPGTYHFSTQQAERMEIQSGLVAVKLEKSDWTEIQAGESFDVPANAGFEIRVLSLTDYCCHYQ